MLNDVLRVEPRDGYRLWLQLQDGVEGEIDLEPHLTFRGVFAPLRDPAYFARVRVNPNWPATAFDTVLFSASFKRRGDSPSC
jgi:hypothetical protein